MYETSWWIEKRVHYMRVVGVNTIEEMLVIDAQLIAQLDESAQLIHFVIDNRDLTQPVPMAEGMKIRHPNHAKTGWIVLIVSNQNPVLRFFASVASRIFNKKYKTCYTPEEAKAFLHEVDSALNFDQTISKKA